MQGDKELACLQYVRDKISSASFPEMKAEEIKNIIEILNTAKPNSDSNKFPDFVISDGYIEEFEINASKEIKGGSKQRMEEAIFETECSKYFSEITECDSSEKGTISLKKCEMLQPQYTREYFLKSFEKHFEKHINSARNYKECSGFRIFLINNTGATFKVLYNGHYIGELYRPSYDKEVLSYLMTYDRELTHIIFRSAQIIEVISLDKLREIKSKVEDGISFESGDFHNVKLNTVLNL